MVCNAGVMASCAVSWRVLFGGEFGARDSWEDEGKWCVITRETGRWESRVLVLMAIAFSSACCGDTVSSFSLILS